MSDETTKIDLGEKPHIPVFVRQPDGTWQHLTVEGQEPGEGSELYSWSEGDFLDADCYEQMLPEDALISNDLNHISNPTAMRVPLRISNGRTKEKQASRNLMLDKLSILHHQWYYLLQNDKHDAGWARSRLEALTEAGRTSQLKLPLSFSSLIDRSQRIASQHTPFETTAELNKSLRESAQNLPQPLKPNSKLMDWEKQLLSPINALAKGYLYATHVAEGERALGRDIRKRNETVVSGKRRTASRFSEVTCKNILLKPVERSPLTLEEKLIIANSASVNPVDFVRQNEILRFHFELIILASEVSKGIAVALITEPAVRLLTVWKANKSAFADRDDRVFKHEMWGLLVGLYPPHEFRSHHIRQIAAALDVLDVVEYLLIKDSKKVA